MLVRNVGTKSFYTSVNLKSHQNDHFEKTIISENSKAFVLFKYTDSPKFQKSHQKFA